MIKLRFIPVITEVGNKRSKIFHVMRGHNHRMNRENAVFFKSKAAARAAGYRESKR
ncbi:sunset domain-containing protein [Lactobacillus crispatus]